MRSSLSCPTSLPLVRHTRRPKPAGARVPKRTLPLPSAWLAALCFAGTACGGGSSPSPTSSATVAANPEPSASVGAPASARSSATAAEPGGAPALSATAGASAARPAASTRRPKRTAPKSFEALAKELDKKCPLADADNNIEQKEAGAKRVACLERRMVKDLDEVLVPLKSHDAARFSALMKEQAQWNRYVAAACDLEEERFWTDFATGERSDGTFRGYPTLGCREGAYSERILYARALAADDPKLVAERVKAKQSQGVAMEKAVAETRTRAEGFKAKPPTLPPDSFGQGDWAAIAGYCEKVQSATAALAQSTCDGWPALAAALGPKEGCASKLTLYYYAQAGSPEPSTP